MAQILRKIPEVVSIQTYAGTAKPFDFNGLVRHSYLLEDEQIFYHMCRMFFTFE
jgi:hypothetical protein